MKSQTENIPIHKDHDVPFLTVSAAHENFTSIVMGMGENPSMVVKVSRRNKPFALLVYYARYSDVIDAMETGHLMPILIRLIANKWLGSDNVPAHLYQVQLDELKLMSQAQLLMLYHADLSTSITALVKQGDFDDEVLIRRLIKRRKICQAIAEAEKDELYEVAEHLSGSRDT